MCDETENIAHVNGRKDFIRHMKNRGIDFDELQVNDSSCNKGTICLINEGSMQIVCPSNISACTVHIPLSSYGTTGPVLFYHVIAYTINGESFTGLNFRGFHGFLKDRKSFPMNILF